MHLSAKRQRPNKTLSERSEGQAGEAAKRSARRGPERDGRIQYRARQMLTIPKKHAQLAFVPKPIKRRAKAGHPSPYEGRELEIAQKVGEKLRIGVPLAVICREPSMPSHDAITEWCQRFPEIGRCIARDREEGFDALAFSCISIADDTSKDNIETEHGLIPNGEWIQRSKVRIETRLKLLAKWSKRYADQPQAVIQNTVNVVQVSVEELAAIAERKQNIIHRLKERA